MLEKSFGDFKHGHTNTNDVERSGHPKEVVILKRSQNHTVKLQEIVDTLKVLKKRVDFSLYDKPTKVSLLKEIRLMTKVKPCQKCNTTVRAKVPHIINRKIRKR